MIAYENNSKLNIDCKIYLNYLTGITVLL